MISWVLLLLVSITIPRVLGDCLCQYTSSDGSLSCSGDSALYLGDTSLFVGTWTLCTSTLFIGSFQINSFNTTQVLYIPDSGSLTVTGDLVIPETTGNVTVEITQLIPSFSNYSTLEVFGNMIVKGNLNISVDNVIVHGSVIVQPTGQLLISGVNFFHVEKNITLSGNGIFQGSPNIINATIIAQSLISLTSVTEIYFSFYNVIINGDIKLNNSPLTIAAITLTTISAQSATISLVQLQMLGVDTGSYNLNKKWHPLNLNSHFNGSVSFTKEWSCGSYYVTPTINTTNGITISLSGANLTIQDSPYCCFESIDECDCAQLSHNPIPSYCIAPCTEWICDKTGFVVGWVIGAIFIVAILSVACFLFCSDFISL
jgi:hypothetical protein